MKVEIAKEIRRSDIAIVGVACRFPDANNYKEYWDNLANGKNSIREITPDRWDITEYYSPNINDMNKSVSKWCGMLDGFEQFDSLFFNISPREAINMDPQQRILLEETWKCVEDSGIPLKELQKLRTSVFMGVMTGDYRQNLASNDVDTDSYSCIGNFEGIIANRISYTFDFKGTSMSINAACASSLVALHKAKQSLALGESDFALAGGVSLNLHPWKYISFSKSRMLSPDGQCKTFDKDANGYVPGEGAGVVLLQRLDDAIRDGNHIYGILKGSDINHGGKSLSITAPRVESQMEVILGAYKDSGISPEDVTYVEAHGTGTSLGDPIEIEALNLAFGKYTDKRQFCRIGSVKTNIGHLEAAAGIAGVIKVLMMMKYRKIPKTLNVNNINPIIDFENTPFKIADRLTDWERKGDEVTLKAGVSSFGFGGVNAHVIVEEYLDKAHTNTGKSDSSENAVFAISAKTADSLKNSIEDWKRFLKDKQYSQMNLTDICLTQIIGRETFPYRWGKVVSSKGELEKTLNEFKESEICKTDNKKWSLLIRNIECSGYDSLTNVFKKYKKFKDSLNDILKVIGKTDEGSKLIKNFKKKKWSSNEEVTVYSFITAYSFFNTLISMGIRPETIQGEKEGLVLALAVCGILKIVDAIDLIRGKKNIEEIVFLRPQISFFDSYTGKTYHPIHFTGDYLSFLMEKLSFQSRYATLVYYADKARLLNTSQFTFKKYLNEWDEIIKKVSGYDILQMLYDDSLLTTDNSKFYKEKILLIIVILSSLRKLNRKWDLTEHKLIDDHKFYELLDLVTDEVMPKEALVSMLMNENPDYDAIAEVLNSRQFCMKKASPYSYIKKRNKKLSEITDIGAWFEGAVKHGLEKEKGFLSNDPPKCISDINETYLMEFLLDLYLDGIELSWNELYADRIYRKQALPVYTFDKKTFLHESKQIDNSSVNASKKNDAGDIKSMNNNGNVDSKCYLIQDSDSELIFKRSINSHSDDIIKDTVVTKYAIVPSPLSIEMAYQALRRAVSGQISELQQVNFPNPGITIGDAVLNVKIDKQSKEFQIFEEKRLISYGKYSDSAAANEKSERIDVNKLCKGNSVCHEEVYSKFVEWGYDFGPTMSCIKNIWESEDAIVVEAVSLPTEEGCVTGITPFLIEGLFQAAIFTGHLTRDIFSDGAGLNVSYSIDALRLFGDLKESCIAVVSKKSFFVDSNKDIYADVIAYDINGNRVAEVKSICLKRMPHSFFDFFLQKEKMMLGVEPETDNDNSINAIYKSMEAYSKKCHESLLSLEQGMATLEEYGSLALLDRFINAGAIDVSRGLTRDEMSRKLGIVPKYQRLLDGVLDMFLRRRYIAEVSKDNYVLSSGIDKTELIRIVGATAEKFERNYPVLVPFKRLMDIGLGEYLNIISGVKSHMSVYFPKGSMEHFEKIYKENDLSDYYNMLVMEALKGYIQVRLREDKNCKVKIVEIGAGIGGTTAPVLEGIKDYGANLEYVYTDISAGFVNYGKRNYGSKYPFTRFEVLDIDKDIENQKVELGAFDVVLETNAIHATADLKETLLRIRKLLKQGGILMLNEISQLQDYWTLVAGLIDGWWLSKDMEKRIPHSPLASYQGWKAVMEDVGFENVVCVEHERKKKYEQSVIVGEMTKSSATGVRAIAEGVQNTTEIHLQFDGNTNEVSDDVVYSKTVTYLKEIFAKKLNLSMDSLGENGAFLEEYGVDSLVSMEVVESLEGIFGELSKTILFEYSTIEKLSRYLIENYLGKLKEILNLNTSIASGSEIPEGNKAVSTPASVSQVDLYPLTCRYLRDVFSNKLNLSPEDIDENGAFLEQYGVDSLVSMELVEFFEEKFGELSKTLLFEYGTIKSLAEYFIQNHNADLTKLVCGESVISDSAQKGNDKTINASANMEQYIPVIGKEDDGGISFIQVKECKNLSNDDIAIIGMNGYFPKSKNIYELWEHLKAGRTCTEEIPADRWDYRKFYEEGSKDLNKSYTKWGGFLDNYDRFDPLFFNISPKQAQLMDPQQRLFLEVVWGAIEDSGYTRSSIARDTGIFVGATTNTYNMWAVEECMKGNIQCPDTDMYDIANRVSYFFDFHGPSISMDTACSSSLTAIHMAIQSLKLGECETAIAGGSSLTLHPNRIMQFTQKNMLLAGKDAHPFGTGSGGFVNSEGVVAVVLKPLSKAIKDKDSIYGVIKGSAINAGGKTSGYTVPSSTYQSDVISKALERAGVDPRTVSYIEAHGTGTLIGDPIEIEGLSKAFRKYTDDNQFCAVGSLKSNLGHLIAAAGIGGLVKVLLQMRNQTLIPSLNADELNPYIDFKNSPFYVQRELTSWERSRLIENGESKEYPRRAGVSSFGAGGANAHLIIEEYVDPEDNKLKENGSEYVILLSAKSRERLKAYSNDMANFLDRFLSDNGQHGFDLEGIAYTLQTGREAMEERLAFTAATIEEAIAKFRAYYCDKCEEFGITCGNTKAAQNASRLLINGEEGKMFIEQLMKNKKYVKLAELWVAGIDLDWEAVYANEAPKKVHLPTYPFNGERYWIPTIEGDLLRDYFEGDTTKRSTGNETVPADISRTQECVFLAEKWSKEAVNENKKAGARNILVFEYDNKVSESLRFCLDEKHADGWKVVTVKQAWGFRDIATDKYELSPDNYEDYLMLFQKLKNINLLPDTIAYLWTGTHAKEPGLRLNEIVEIEFNRLVAMSKALLEIKPGKEIEVLYTFDGGFDDLKFYYPAVYSFAQTVFLENPKLIYKVLQIKGVSEGFGNNHANKLLNEIASESQPLWIMLEDENRYVRQLDLLKTGEGSNKAVIRSEGVYVITGGAGGIGFIIARHLAAKYNAKVVITGRSELSTSIEEKLKLINNLGGQAIYIKADVSKKRDLTSLVSKVRACFGGINGVIHCAGVNKDSFLIKKTPEDIETVFSPKINGTVNLDEATWGEALDFFVMFSSVTSEWGNEGQSDYSFANGFMDRYALYREYQRKAGNRSGVTVSISWPLWNEGGMEMSHQVRDEFLGRLRMEAMPSETGIRAFEACLASGENHVNVCYGFKDKILELIGKTPVANPNAAFEYIFEDINDEMLYEKTEQFLKKVIGDEIGLLTGMIDSRTTFDQYGIDSIIIHRFNLKLKECLGDRISKTLLFEYKTMEHLTKHFVDEYKTELKKMFSTVKKAVTQPAYEQVAAARSFVSEAEVASTVEKSEGVDEAQAIQKNSGSIEEEIAVIGMSGRFPGAGNIDEFWGNLTGSKDSVTEIPLNRWDNREYFDPDVEKAYEGKIYCKWGGFVDDFDKFDPLFFNISPREAETMDPQERLFLETAYNTLEDAGYAGERLRRNVEEGSNIGVFVGVTSNTYEVLGPEQWEKGNMTIPTSFHWSIANRVSYILNLRGPSLPFDTACSSSLTAIHQACESLKRGECELAIAGGVNLCLHPSKYVMMCQLKMLSKTGKCHSFGEDGDGFVPGEGVGAVLLKPLSKAISDGDQIYGVLKGSWINHGGKTNGYTVPNPNAQAEVIEKCAEVSGINPRTISYIEAHGTGTSLGDPIEITGLTKAFRKYTNDNSFCAIGSVKSNIGHLEASAGVTGLIKILLQMKYKKLVPSLHAERLNSNINFQNTPFVVQRELADWDRPLVLEGDNKIEMPRRAGISSFGAGGVNAHVMVEEYEENSSRVSETEGNGQIFIFSAKSQSRLKAYAERMSSFLSSKQKGMSKERSFTTNTTGCLKKDIKKLIAKIANVDEYDVADEESLSEYGFDAFMTVSLTERINEMLQIRMEASKLRADYSVCEVADSIVSQYKEKVQKFYDRTGFENVAEPGYKSLGDIAYTLQVGREHFEERLAIVATSVGDLIDTLEQYVNGKGEVQNLYAGNVKMTDRDSINSRGFENKLTNAESLGDLNRIALLWASGEEIDWLKMHTGKNRRFVSLPVYPFEKERYWICEEDFKGVGNSYADERTSSEIDEYLKEFFHKPEWVIKDGEDSESCNGNLLSGKQTVLIVTCNETFGLDKLISEAHSKDNVIEITMSNSEKRGQSVVYIDKSVRDSFDNCIKNIEQLDKIYFLGVCGKHPEGSDLIQRTDELQDEFVIPYFRMIRALNKHGWTQKQLVVKVITNNVNKVLAGDKVLPWGGVLSGLARSSSKEFENWDISCIDVSIEEFETGKVPIEKSKLAEAITGNIFVPKGEGLCFRRGSKYVLKLRNQQIERNGEIPFREKGVYLILGGMGRIGFELAKHLAKTVKARLVIIGSSPENQSKREKIKLIESLGGQAVYYKANAASQEEMDDVIKKARACFGALNGAIHSAVNFKTETLVNMDEEDFKAVLEPKVRASSVFAKVLEKEPLDFLLFFSSGDSILPLLGHSAYVAGCAFEDALGLYLDSISKYPVRVINWGFWEPTQEQADRMSSNGLASQKTYLNSLVGRENQLIFPEAGMEAVLRVLQNKEPQLLAMSMKKGADHNSGSNEDSAGMPSLLEKLGQALKNL